LRRRLDSVRRVLEASDQLSVRIAELEEGQRQVERQLAGLQAVAAGVGQVLERREIAADASVAPV
jgi:hypothetical protein